MHNDDGYGFVYAGSKGKGGESWMYTSHSPSYRVYLPCTINLSIHPYDVVIPSSPILYCSFVYAEMFLCLDCYSCGLFFHGEHSHWNSNMTKMIKLLVNYVTYIVYDCITICAMFLLFHRHIPTKVTL
jgi:hypothetical protein